MNGMIDSFNHFVFLLKIAQFLTNHLYNNKKIAFKSSILVLIVSNSVVVMLV